MKRTLWIAVFVVMVAVIACSCGAPGVVPPITEEEREAMVETALADPEVSKWLEGDDTYSVEDGWVVIAWEGSKAVGWYWMDYEDIKDGTPPAEIAYLTDDVTINPQLYIRIGEPPGMFVSVIYDSEREKVLSIQLQPGRKSPGPTLPDNPE